MKRPAFYNYLSIIPAVVLLIPFQSFARPIDFNELSLLVRVRESDSSIKDEVSRRKLMHSLTAQEESTLKAQGASDSLVQSLRNSGWVASKEEVAVAEKSDRQMKAEARAEMAMENAGPRVLVFNVAFGHPINLSQW